MLVMFPGKVPPPFWRVGEESGVTLIMLVSIPSYLYHVIMPLPACGFTQAEHIVIPYYGLRCHTLEAEIH